MSEKVSNWGRWALIATCILALPIVTGYMRSGFAIADTPEKTAELAAKLENLETNSATQFEHINWQLKRMEAKIDDLTPPASYPPGAPSPKGQDQNLKGNP